MTECCHKNKQPHTQGWRLRFESISAHLARGCYDESWGWEHTYTSLSKAWSVGVVEKCCSRMDTVPVSATWPQPQNNATPEKQRMVATSEAYGTPPRHLMQHSKQPKQKRESKRNVMTKKANYEEKNICPLLGKSHRE